MSLTRFAPQLSRAFQLPLSSPKAWGRAAIIPFFLILGAAWVRALDAGWASATAQAITALAFGLFGLQWQRWAALDEAPAWFPRTALLPRVLAWAVAYQILLAFEGFPAPFLAIMVGDRADAAVLVLAGLQLFQFLIGAMFLVLPALALARPNDGGAKLQELVLAGGLALGLGYVLAGLPFVLISQALAETKGGLPDTQAVIWGIRLLETMISLAAATVTGAFFAYAWTELKAVTPARLASARLAPAPPQPPAKKGKAATGQSPAKTRSSTRKPRGKRR